MSEIPGTFVQERLDALHDIDCKIVSLLDNVSTLFETYSESRTGNLNDVKESFSEQTQTIYGILSKVAIDLRKEVKTMDDNIGAYDKNKDNVMILPISVDQKNTKLGTKKMEEQLKELEDILKPEKTENGEDIEVDEI